MTWHHSHHRWMGYDLLTDLEMDALHRPSPRSRVAHSSLSPGLVSIFSAQQQTEPSPPPAAAQHNTTSLTCLLQGGGACLVLPLVFLVTLWRERWEASTAQRCCVGRRWEGRVSAHCRFMQGAGSVWRSLGRHFRGSSRLVFPPVCRCPPCSRAG